MIVKSSEERGGNTASSAANVKRSMENLNKCVMYCTDEVRNCEYVYLLWVCVICDGLRVMCEVWSVICDCMFYGAHQLEI